MTKPHVIGDLSYLGTGLVKVKESANRHVCIFPTLDLPFRESSVADHGGIGYDWEPLYIFGGGATAFKGLGATTGTVSLEWNLGHLLADRQWTLSVAFKTGPNRGIIVPKVNGVALGAGLDCYHATNYAEIRGTWNWNPGPTDIWKNSTLRLESNSKNAASSAFGLSIAHIAFDRTAGAATVTLDSP